MRSGRRAARAVGLHGIGLACLCLVTLSALAADRPVVRSACEYDYPPFCVVGKDGAADGFSVALLRAALGTVGHDVAFAVGAWTELKQDLATGRLQVLPMVGRTPEREAIFDFTFPYLTLHGAIFVREGDDRIKTVADLADKELLVLAGDNAEEYARRVDLSSRIIPVATYPEAMKLLRDGKHDAVLAQHLMGAQLLRDMKIRRVVALPLQLPGFFQDFCFAVQEGDAAMLSLLNEGLSIAVADGTFDRLHAEWLGPLVVPRMTIGQLVRTVAWVAIPLLLVGIVVFVLALRREVAVKTRALVESNVAWKETFDAVPDMIAIIDADSKILRINAAMARQVGERPDALIGKRCHEVVHHTARRYGTCPHRRLLVEGKEQCEELYEERLGGHCRITTSPLRSAQGELIGSVHVARDINAQKEAEAVLEEQIADTVAEVQHKSEDLVLAEQRYRIVADFTYDWEYWELPDGTLAYVSPSCESITGYAADAFVQNPKLLDEIVDASDEALWRTHCKAREAPGVVLALRFRIVTRDGKRRWIEHACQRVEEDGEFLGYRVSNRDISERQEASSERNALRSQIAHISRVNAMGELTAALAHEINQPLGAILSNAQAAVRFLRQESPDLDEVREALDDIVSDDKRAGEVVRRLRRMVRTGTPDYERTRMRDVIDEVLSLVHSELVLRHVRVTRMMMPKVQEMLCDRVQIQQVLLNLITNAIDAMEHTPREDRELTVRMVRADENFVEVSVRDHGAGMTPESIETVFKPFYTTKRSGMGMGLAISRSIVELHRGKLWAERNHDEGMTFSFSIPCERSSGDDQDQG